MGYSRGLKSASFLFFLFGLMVFAAALTVALLWSLVMLWAWALPSMIPGVGFALALRSLPDDLLGLALGLPSMIPGVGFVKICRGAVSRFGVDPWTVKSWEPCGGGSLVCRKNHPPKKIQ